MPIPRMYARSLTISSYRPNRNAAIDFNLSAVQTRAMDLTRKNVVTLALLSIAVLAAGVSYGQKSATTKSASLIDAEGNVIPGSVDPGCSTNADCPGKASICRNAVCIELKDPRCHCSENKTMTCVDALERAKNTYCEKGCQGNATSGSCIE